ncbi:MAG TPA: hypothetical protein VEU96_27230 [Bryobacteraceae bacterium]|nr:hypothetical protein [Bryobacteraceae bacterium]
MAHRIEIRSLVKPVNALRGLPLAKMWRPQREGEAYTPNDGAGGARRSSFRTSCRVAIAHDAVS